MEEGTAIAEPPLDVTPLVNIRSGQTNRRFVLPGGERIDGNFSFGLSLGVNRVAVEKATVDLHQRGVWLVIAVEHNHQYIVRRLILLGEMPKRRSIDHFQLDGVEYL